MSRAAMWGEPRFITWNPQFWEARSWELYDHDGGLAGLGNFLKSIHRAVRSVALAPIKAVTPNIAKKIEAVDEKLVKIADDIHTKVNNFAKKHWKVLAIIAIIVITIYTMGAGATIAAKLLAGCKAIAAKVGFGAAASSAGAGAGAGTAVATGVATTGAVTTGATVATTAATTGISMQTVTTVASLAMSGAKMLLEKKKVSELEQQQAQALLTMQAQGQDMVDPELQALLEKRAAFPGGPIKYDAQGRPYQDDETPQNLGGLNLGIRPEPNPEVPGATRVFAPDGTSLTPSTSGLPGWAIPAGIAALGLLLVLKK